MNKLPPPSKQTRTEFKTNSLQLPSIAEIHDFISTMKVVHCGSHSWRETLPQYVRVKDSVSFSQRCPKLTNTQLKTLLVGSYCLILRAIDLDRMSFKKKPLKWALLCYISVKDNLTAGLPLACGFPEWKL